MADSKRTECVKVCMEPKMLVDVHRLAVLEDRKVADYIYLLLRRDTYGKAGKVPAELEGTERDHDAP